MNSVASFLNFSYIKTIWGQLHNLFMQYSPFFLVVPFLQPDLSEWHSNFQLLGDLLNSSVWEAIFVSNYFLKYNYQILLNIFHSMIAIDTCRKSPVMGNEDMAFHQNVCYILRFFVQFFFYLSVFKKFIHAYMYNIWFVLANNRFLKTFFFYFKACNNDFNCKYAQIL